MDLEWASEAELRGQRNSDNDRECPDHARNSGRLNVAIGTRIKKKDELMTLNFCEPR